MLPLAPHQKIWIELSALCLELGAEAVHAARRRLKPQARYPGLYRTRRPGRHTPRWNLCATRLRRELKARGAKARFARYLGLPRQRISDFLTGRRRLPDAETLLEILHWLAAKQAGRDLSL